MNPAPHHCEISQPKRSFKKSLNRPQTTSLLPTPQALPSVMTTSMIKDSLRDWNRDGKLARRSPRTLEARKHIVERFEAFLIDSKASYVSTDDIAAFFELLRSGAANLDALADPSQPAEELKPSTELTYFSYLRAFFRWCVKRGTISRSPMEFSTAPLVPEEELKPFTQDQLRLLLDAARKSHNPVRNEAIVRILLDNGLRVSELCSLNVGQINWDGPMIQDVIGKGGKKRSVPIGLKSARVLVRYIEQDASHMAAQKRGVLDHQALFLSDRGKNSGNRMTRFGIAQLIESLSISASIIQESLSYTLIVDPDEALVTVKSRKHLQTRLVEAVIALGGKDVSFESVQKIIKCPQTKSGLKTLVSRKILCMERTATSPVRCSPHTLRHTFGISYLRNGRSVLDVKRVLGHRSLAMTNRYLHMAETDIVRSHLESSPSDAL